MDEWFIMFLNAMLNGTNPQQKKEGPAGIRLKNRHKLVQGNTTMKTVTYTEIQEGEFEEIENAETGEIAVRELADQASDRRKEILCDEADEGRVQGGSEDAVCGLRDREEEFDDGGGSD